MRPGVTNALGKCRASGSVAPGELRGEPHELQAFSLSVRHDQATCRQQANVRRFLRGRIQIGLFGIEVFHLVVECQELFEVFGQLVRTKSLEHHI
jgi:hypothetical protein